MLALRTYLDALAIVVVMMMLTHEAPAWTVVGWSDVGLNSIDADYSVLSTMPPANTIHAQIIDDAGRLIGDDASIIVTYEAVADPIGSINSSSVGKTNFWQHVQALFAVALPPDSGLLQSAMPGLTDQPQALRFDATQRRFVADAIPITPYDDAGHVNPYPLMRLVAKDRSGTVLATSDVVLPVSDEMNCAACHASDTTPGAQPSTGWVHDPDPQRDVRLNILRLHDDRESGRDRFQQALAATHYESAGLFATAVGGTPILCARCHASNALAGSGLSGITPLTQAVHQRMAYVFDPISGGALDATGTRVTCYRCHPGVVTRSLRGVMGSAVTADGAYAVECQSCHGRMIDVASSSRTGWTDEPMCQSCHTGTATHNNGQLRYFSAFEASGTARVAVDQTFATSAETSAPNPPLFHLSTGHGGLACPACHGPAHAESPSAQPNDNLQSIAEQGHAGVLVECSVCHGQSPNTATGGPHGMHPVGPDWVDVHPDTVDALGTTGCQSCHGADLRGTVLTRAHADRMLNTAYGTQLFWRGFEIGCYSCHQKGNRANHPPIVAEVAASTAPGTARSIPLSASDEDGNALTLRIVSQPQHGRAGISGTQATYFPDPEFTGDDLFTYAARDELTDSNLGTVRMTVTSTPCPVSCDGTGVVSVDQIERVIDMLYGDSAVSSCPVLDLNGNGVITANEVVDTIRALLNGCPQRP